MRDSECIDFLQQMLPRLRFQWKGFRKVRKQVCKRIDRRIRELGLADTGAYRDHLESEPGERALLDGLCRVTISRFYRDKGVFGCIGKRLLPELAEEAENKYVRIWSAGCASGEEAYTLSLIWRVALAGRFEGVRLKIVATDSDPVMLSRGQKGCYRRSSLKALPEAWIESAFIAVRDTYCLDDGYRKGVHFLRQDIRTEMPEGPFDMVLCRNLVFTYFDAALQRELLAKIGKRVRLGGFLVVGTHESLPEGVEGFERVEGVPGVYRRSM
jgi:chemotaxis protein methyltransferase CheR